MATKTTTTTDTRREQCLTLARAAAARGDTMSARHHARGAPPAPSAGRAADAAPEPVAHAVRRCGGLALFSAEEIERLVRLLIDGTSSMTTLRIAARIAETAGQLVRRIAEGDDEE